MILTDDRDLSFNFTDAIDAIVFDQMKRHLPNFHGVQAMHKVDFVVEVNDSILFIEVKDPEHPRAQKEALAEFLEKLNNGILSSNFADKFIDTFLYRWAEDKLHKPVHYIGLVTFLEEPLLNNLSSEIEKKLPPLGCSVPRWQRKLFENCQFFNIKMWNENFPQRPVHRISQSSVHFTTSSHSVEGA